MKKQTNWRQDKKFISSISFILLVMTTASYVILADKTGEDVANFLLDNYADLYRVLFPNEFAIENPRAGIQAIRFTFSLIFNILGLGVAVFAWEARKEN
jgi:hypothetical protein